MGNIWEKIGVECDESQKQIWCHRWSRTWNVKVHLPTLMDLYHLKDSEWEKKHQNNAGRVVLRGDMVKDGSGSYAVFTEQGSSVSQMTATKIMDMISRLFGCARQAAAAVSAYIQAKVEHALTLCWKIQNRNVQTSGYVSHETNGPNHGPAWQTQSFLLNEICMVILWQDYYGKCNLRKSYWNMDGRKFQIGNVSLYIV